jgi:hypothetical protein
MDNKTHDIKVLLERYNLHTEGYKPGNVKLYAVYNGEKLISHYMTHSDLYFWLCGYDKAKEG